MSSLPTTLPSSPGQQGGVLHGDYSLTAMLARNPIPMKEIVTSLNYRNPKVPNSKVNLDFFCDYQDEPIPFESFTLDNTQHPKYSEPNPAVHEGHQKIVDLWHPLVANGPNGLNCHYRLLDSLHTTNLGSVYTGVALYAPTHASHHIIDEETLSPIPQPLTVHPEWSTLSFLGEGFNPTDSVNVTINPLHCPGIVIAPRLSPEANVIQLEQVPQTHTISLLARLSPEAACGVSSITLGQHPCLPPRRASFVGMTIEASHDGFSWELIHEMSEEEGNLFDKSEPDEGGRLHFCDFGRAVFFTHWRLTWKNAAFVALSCCTFNQFVAIKRTMRSRVKKATLGDNPLREPVTQRLASSPWVARVLSVHNDPIFDPQYIWVVSQYYPDKDLFHLLNSDRGPTYINLLPKDRVGMYFVQLVLAVYYMHHYLHMVHLDLKPANILLFAKDQVVLTDFGMARRLRPITEAYTPLTNGHEFSAEFLVRTQPKLQLNDIIPRMFADHGAHLLDYTPFHSALKNTRIKWHHDNVQTPNRGKMNEADLYDIAVLNAQASPNTSQHYHQHPSIPPTADYYQVKNNFPPPEHQFHNNFGLIGTKDYLCPFVYQGTLDNDSHHRQLHDEYHQNPSRGHPGVCQFYDLHFHPVWKVVEFLESMLSRAGPHWNKEFLSTLPFHLRSEAKLNRYFQHCCSVLKEGENTYVCSYELFHNSYYHRIVEQEAGKPGVVDPKYRRCIRDVYGNDLCYLHTAVMYGYDARYADIFSLGVILFTILFKVPPYTDFPGQNNSLYRKFSEQGSRSIMEAFARQFPNLRENADPDAFDLIDTVCSPHLERRIYIEQLICHPYFTKHLKSYIQQQSIICLTSDFVKSRMQSVIQLLFPTQFRTQHRYHHAEFTDHSIGVFYEHYTEAQNDDSETTQASETNTSGRRHWRRPDRRMDPRLPFYVDINARLFDENVYQYVDHGLCSDPSQLDMVYIDKETSRQTVINSHTLPGILAEHRKHYEIFGHAWNRAQAQYQLVEYSYQQNNIIVEENTFNYVLNDNYQQQFLRFDEADKFLMYENLYTQTYNNTREVPVEPPRRPTIALNRLNMHRRFHPLTHILSHMYHVVRAYPVPIIPSSGTAEEVAIIEKANNHIISIMFPTLKHLFVTDDQEILASIRRYTDIKLNAQQAKLYKFYDAKQHQDGREIRFAHPAYYTSATPTGPYSSEMNATLNRSYLCNNLYTATRVLATLPPIPPSFVPLFKSIILVAETSKVKTFYEFLHLLFTMSLTEQEYNICYPVYKRGQFARDNQLNYDLAELTDGCDMFYPIREHVRDHLVTFEPHRGSAGHKHTTAFSPTDPLFFDLHDIRGDRLPEYQTAPYLRAQNTYSKAFMSNTPFEMLYRAQPLEPMSIHDPILSAVLPSRFLDIQQNLGARRGDLPPQSLFSGSSTGSTPVPAGMSSQNSSQVPVLGLSGPEGHSTLPLPIDPNACTTIDGPPAPTINATPAISEQRGSAPSIISSGSQQPSLHHHHFANNYWSGVDPLEILFPRVGIALFFQIFSLLQYMLSINNYCWGKHNFRLTFDFLHAWTNNHFTIAFIPNNINTKPSSRGDRLAWAHNGLEYPILTRYSTPSKTFVQGSISEQDFRALLGTSTTSQRLSSIREYRRTHINQRDVIQTDPVMSIRGLFYVNVWESTIVDRPNEFINYNNVLPPPVPTLQTKDKIQYGVNSVDFAKQEPILPRKLFSVNDTQTKLHDDVINDQSLANKVLAVPYMPFNTHFSVFRGDMYAIQRQHFHPLFSQNQHLLRHHTDATTYSMYSVDTNYNNYKVMNGLAKMPHGAKSLSTYYDPNYDDTMPISGLDLYPLHAWDTVPFVDHHAYYTNATRNYDIFAPVHNPWHHSTHAPTFATPLDSAVFSPMTYQQNVIPLFSLTNHNYLNLFASYAQREVYHLTEATINKRLFPTKRIDHNAPAFAQLKEELAVFQNNKKQSIFAAKMNHQLPHDSTEPLAGATENSFYRMTSHLNQFDTTLALHMKQAQACLDDIHRFLEICANLIEFGTVREPDRPITPGAVEIQVNAEMNSLTHTVFKQFFRFTPYDMEPSFDDLQIMSKPYDPRFYAVQKRMYANNLFLQSLFHTPSISMHQILHFHNLGHIDNSNDDAGRAYHPQNYKNLDFLPNSTILPRPQYSWDLAYETLKAQGAWCPSIRLEKSTFLQVSQDYDSNIQSQSKRARKQLRMDDIPTPTLSQSDIRDSGADQMHDKCTETCPPRCFEMRNNESTPEKDLQDPSSLFPIPLRLIEKLKMRKHLHNTPKPVDHHMYTTTSEHVSLDFAISPLPPAPSSRSRRPQVSHLDNYRQNQLQRQYGRWVRYPIPIEILIPHLFPSHTPSVALLPVQGFSINPNHPLFKPMTCEYPILVKQDGIVSPQYTSPQASSVYNDLRPSESGASFSTLPRSGSTEATIVHSQVNIDGGAHASTICWNWPRRQPGSIYAGSLSVDEEKSLHIDPRIHADPHKQTPKYAMDHYQSLSDIGIVTNLPIFAEWDNKYTRSRLMHILGDLQRTLSCSLPPYIPDQEFDHNSFEAIPNIHNIPPSLLFATFPELINAQHDPQYFQDLLKIHATLLKRGHAQLQSGNFEVTFNGAVVLSKSNNGTPNSMINENSNSFITANNNSMNLNNISDNNSLIALSNHENRMNTSSFSAESSNSSNMFPALGSAPFNNHGLVNLLNSRCQAQLRCELAKNAPLNPTALSNPVTHLMLTTAPTTIPDALPHFTKPLDLPPADYDPNSHVILRSSVDASQQLTYTIERLFQQPTNQRHILSPFITPQYAIRNDREAVNAKWNAVVNFIHKFTVQQIPYMYHFFDKQTVAEAHTMPWLPRANVSPYLAPPQYTQYCMVKESTPLQTLHSLRIKMNRETDTTAQRQFHRDLYERHLWCELIHTRVRNRLFTQKLIRQCPEPIKNPEWYHIYPSTNDDSVVRLSRSSAKLQTVPSTGRSSTSTISMQSPRSHAARGAELPSTSQHSFD